MKTIYVSLVACTFYIMCSTTLSGQIAFHRNALLISISEGSTHVNYASGFSVAGQFQPIHSEREHGNRDPLILEYGICNHLGIGFTCGKDIYNINPTNFYSSSSTGSNVHSITSDFTLDASYHFYVTRRTDFAAVLGFGGYNVKVNNSDNNYDASQGHISRIGVRGRYYFYKRLGAFGMLSFYRASAAPKAANVNDGQMHVDIVNYPITTHVTGRSLEFGLCYRFF